MIDEADTWKACAEVADKDEKYVKALIQLLEVEKENPHGEWIGYKSPTGKAWEIPQTPVPPQTVQYLARKGLVVMFYKTRSTKAYHLVNPNIIEEFIDYNERGTLEVQAVQDNKKILQPAELFSWISGYEDEKRWIRRWATKRISRGDWTPNHGDPTVSSGIALTGPGGTAKSDFLLDCNHLPKAYYTTGTYISGPGLWDILYDGDYWFLIIDECEKMKAEDWNLLYTMLGNMFIQRDQRNRHKTKTLDINVLVASNRWKRVDEAMRQRFRDWGFSRYTLEEYLSNAKYCLIHRYGIDEELADYIAHVTSKFTRNVRTAIFYGLMCDTFEEVDDLYVTEMKRGVRE